MNLKTIMVGALLYQFRSHNTKNLSLKLNNAHLTFSKRFVFG